MGLLVVVLPSRLHLLLSFGASFWGGFGRLSLSTPLSSKDLLLWKSRID